jgi:hypothetical protein
LRRIVPEGTIFAHSKQGKRRATVAVFEVKKENLVLRRNRMAGKPNILIIWGDDIGWFNISAYNHGIMGYRTPNIDRIAKEGALFTDWYG